MIVYQMIEKDLYMIIMVIKNAMIININFNNKNNNMMIIYIKENLKEDKSNKLKILSFLTFLN